MKPKYPLHLRLANVRRWLNARVPANGKNVALKKDDEKKLYQMICEQLLPIALREDGAGWIDLVLCEHPKNWTKKQSKDWYVLQVGFRHAHDATKWIKKHLDTNAFTFTLLA